MRFCRQFILDLAAACLKVTSLSEPLPLAHDCHNARPLISYSHKAPAQVRENACLESTLTFSSRIDRVSECRSRSCEKLRKRAGG